MPKQKPNKKQEVIQNVYYVPEVVKFADIEIQSLSYDVLDLTKIIKMMLKDKKVCQYLGLYERKKLMSSYSG